MTTSVPSPVDVDVAQHLPPDGYTLQVRQVFTPVPASAVPTVRTLNLRFVSVAGFTFGFGPPSAQQLRDEAAAQGITLYFVVAYENPPGFFGTGFDDWWITTIADGDFAS